MYIGRWLGHYTSEEWANIGISILAHRWFDGWPSNGPMLADGDIDFMLAQCWVPGAGPTF